MPGCGGPGATVTFKVGDYWANETGLWQAGQPQSLELTGPRMRMTTLVQGCGNQATITFTNKTAIKALRAAIEPEATLAGIWKWNAKVGQWDGNFPNAPDALNTLKTIDRLDVIWICATGSANLTQPAIDAG